MKRSIFALAVAVLVLMTGLGPADTPRIALRDDLSDFQRKVTTSSEQAQKYFDQGMTLYYAFNHDAAIASFAEAVALDTTCAMAWWGQAISAGPNINNAAMDSAAARLAWDAVHRASRLAPRASPLEQELIQALASRYTWPAPADRKPLDRAYADAMYRVWQRHPDDAEIGVLYADALMNLRPWDLWTLQGEPQPGTMEIVQTLEKVMTMVPDHPGATHFYVHTMEASPHPERALPAANVLRDRIPGAGHLVHMPSHIDIRVGHYDDAIRANQRGISVDSTWISQPGFYAFYRSHNYHFLTYAAMFEGRRELAMQSARAMVQVIPMDVVRQMPDFLDGILAAPIHVMVRFGMWDSLLAEPKPPEDLLATTAFWHYGRTVAFAASGRTDESAAELAALQKAYDAVPDSRLIGNNSARTVLMVGLPMAEGELEYRKGNHERAFELLRTAVRRDDSLRYDEPWGWMMPVRHSLGALFLEEGRVDDAEAVYREDLRLHPNNGWALKGLSECMHLKGNHEEAEKTDVMFRQAWARADIEIQASCFCRPVPSQAGK